MRQNDETFQWNDCEASMVFPIDYTSNEAAEVFGQDARGFRNHVLRHPYFRDILQELAPHTDSGDLMPPIPLEAALLLDCFYHLAKKTKQGYHKSIYCWKEEATPDAQIMDHFLDELYRDLYARIAPPPDDEGQDLYAYCRQALFQNKHFTSTLFSSIWKQHITQRYERLQQLIEQAPIEQQIQAMADCLVSLDRTILILQTPSSEDSAPSPEPDKGTAVNQEPEPVLTQLLKNLLSVRLSAKRCTGDRITYTLPNNVPVDEETTLEKAFWGLGNRKGRNPAGDNFAPFLSAARQAYWTCLSQELKSRQPKGIAFLEETYKQLHRYLTLSALPQDQIKDRIKESCIRYCQQIITECLGEPSQKLSRTSLIHQSNYEQDLIDSLAYEYLEHTTDTIHGFIQIVSFYNAGHLAATDYVIYDQLLCENGLKLGISPIFPLSQGQAAKNPIYDDAIALQAYFQDAWECIYPNPGPVFDETSHCFLDTDATATKLREGGLAAAQLFSKESIVPSLEELKEQLRYTMQSSLFQISFVRLLYSGLQSLQCYRFSCFNSCKSWLRAAHPN